MKPLDQKPGVFPVLILGTTWKTKHRASLESKRKNFAQLRIIFKQTNLLIQIVKYTMWIAWFWPRWDSQSFCHSCKGVVLAFFESKKESFVEKCHIFVPLQNDNCPSSLLTVSSYSDDHNVNMNASAYELICVSNWMYIICVTVWTLHFQFDITKLCISYPLYNFSWLSLTHSVTR